MRCFARWSQAPIRQGLITRPKVTAPFRPFSARPASAFTTGPVKPRSRAPITTKSQVRHNSTETASNKTASVRIAPERKPWRAAPHRRPDEPVYELYFTCKACQHRSGHSISKQGYHHGTTLVQCPSCRNRHLISDHLKIFYDKGMTLEDIMKEKGESIKMGSLDQQGDVEFWDEAAAKAGEGQAEPDVKP